MTMTRNRKCVNIICMRQILTVLLLLIYFFSGVRLFSSDLFFSYKADRPLFLFIQAGIPVNDAKPVEIDENTEINPGWNISGALIFASYDKTRDMRYNGISAASLTAIQNPDWSRIRYKVTLSWKGAEGKLFTKDILEGDFNDTAVKKYEEDDFNSDDSTYIRDYKFSIILKDTSYRFLMPLAPETYKMKVEISYPVTVWRKSGTAWKQVQAGTMTSRTPETEILVIDTTPPEITLLKGLEKNCGSCTSGDPLPDDAADVSILVCDNNPNSDIRQVSLESNGQYYLFPISKKTISFDEDQAQRFIGEFSFHIPNRTGQILKAPADGSPLKYEIIASDSVSNAGSLNSEIPCTDNDPPDVKFIFNDISGIISKDTFDPIGKKGMLDIDITDLNSRKALYVDKYEAPDPEAVILKTSSIIVRQNTRVMFQAFPYDNSDRTPGVTLNGQTISKEGKLFIFSDSSKNDVTLEVNDVSGNIRRIIIPIQVRKMYFNSNTLGSGQ